MIPTLLQIYRGGSFQLKNNLLELARKLDKSIRRVCLKLFDNAIDVERNIRPFPTSEM